MQETIRKYLGSKKFMAEKHLAHLVVKLNGRNLSLDAFYLELAIIHGEKQECKN